MLAVARVAVHGPLPDSNGLVGLAHHGWEYRADVRTLPQILSESGYHTALFGMQHETSYPARLGFDTYDVSNWYCEYVVDHATRWLTEAPQQPFLLTAGFFETHRPYPHDRYEPADRTNVELPAYLPDSDAVRQDLAEFYGAITVADAAVGQLLDTLAATGLDRTTWVVFVTDHGPALPRAKSTLYDAGTGIATSCARPSTVPRRPSPTTICSAGSTCCPPCWGSSDWTCQPMSRGCHTPLRCAPNRPARALRGVYDEDLSRLLRSDTGSQDKGIQLHRELRDPPAARPAVGYRRQPVLWRSLTE